MSLQDKTIYIGYGIGCNYQTISAQIKEKIELSYLCDRKWDASVEYFDNIPVISKIDIPKIENAKVVIFPEDIPIKKAIAKDLETMGVEYVFVGELLERRSLSGKEIKAEGVCGVWEDALHNKVYYDETLPDEVIIFFLGKDSHIHFEENVVTERLIIIMGNDGVCKIGANTRIVGASMLISYAKVLIGADYLFSAGINIRTHDSHHIFDRDSHKRINTPKDVILHDHVWLGEDAYLLPGANIGEGSIVGARAVTSGTFGDHVIIAGVPARVIRENICWSKDTTEIANFSCVEDCISYDAMKYC